MSQKIKKIKDSSLSKEEIKDSIEKYQLELLEIHQGLRGSPERVIIMFEGIDAAGKGGAIKALTELLDPRSFEVHPIGPPSAYELGKHWLYRFWMRLPNPGTTTIFDRSWYGRVLVEKVEKLTPKEKLKRAYDEINQFEEVLQNDGIILLKFFLTISKDEQLSRFEARLKDPSKAWKVSMDDIQARDRWDEYADAVKTLLKKTDTKACPWYVIAHDDKKQARLEILKIAAKRLAFARNRVDSDAEKEKKKEFGRAIEKELESRDK